MTSTLNTAAAIAARRTMYETRRAFRDAPARPGGPVLVCVDGLVVIRPRRDLARFAAEPVTPSAFVALDL